MPYEIRLTDEVDAWLHELADTDMLAYRLAVEHINMLESTAPVLDVPRSARSTVPPSQT
ncbi:MULTISPECIES: hypothetical protein [unclassified Nonomuraea]|uniref:hypothetical protein n=1 Tax=unclassified Nonomuraea TaxID=2593643 RepID=UPI001F270436|nr:MULTISPECIES: hypothetical protein [unclassified Nonomuraea]